MEVVPRVTAFFFLERPAVSHSSLSLPPSAPSASSSALQCQQSDPCVHKASQTAGTPAAMHCMCRIQIEGLAYALLRSDGTEGRLDMKLDEGFLQQSRISWTAVTHQRVIWQRLDTDLGAFLWRSNEIRTGVAEGCGVEEAQVQQLLVRGVEQEVEELLRILLLPRGRSGRRCRSRRRLACAGIHNPIKNSEQCRSCRISLMYCMRSH